MPRIVTSSSIFSPDMGLGPTQSSAEERRALTLPQVYKEHKNCETVKDVNFFGPKCEYVVSGSDCGRIFIWRKKDGALLRAMEADKHVVNCVESHPHLPTMSSCGIESDIKIWAPGGTQKLTSSGTAKQVMYLRHLIIIFLLLC